MVFGQLIPTNNYNNNNNNNNKCILEKTHVTGSIVHSFATLTFYQQFKIMSKDFYSVYINPPEGCVIYNIKGRFNGKLTEFIVHELEEPVEQGYYDSNSNSDAVSLTLGEIPIKTSVVIEITCTFTASLISPDTFIFNIPYDQSLLNSRFSADICVNMLKQNLPKINISEGSFKMINGHLVISPFIIQKHLQIGLKFANPILSAAFSAQVDHFNYIGLSMHPTALKEKIHLKQEIYLLIDCSGSMAGGKIKNAQDALVKFLKALPKDCYFNILRFGSTFEQMFEHTVENNKKNMNKAMKFASILNADLGGTDIYSPLMSIIEQKPRKGYVRQVFALTDGEVEYGANVIAACTSNRHIMRVFPFGIGTNVNRAFLKDLAKSTNGVAHFIDYNNIQEGISNSVLSTLNSSQVSAIVNTQIYVDGVDLFEVAPHPIPSLFADDLTHVFLRYESINNKSVDSILITGDISDSSYEETIPIIKTGRLIDFHKLFAYNNIRDMEDRLMNSDDTVESEIMKENIIRLSMQCAVVSSFTGMFTVINGVEQKGQNLPQYDSYEQMYSNYQQGNMQCCQQQMTQKQCWCQMAYGQMGAPMQQAPQGWGSSQMQKQKNFNQNIQKRMPQNIIQQTPMKITQSTSQQVKSPKSQNFNQSIQQQMQQNNNNTFELDKIFNSDQEQIKNSSIKTNVFTDDPFVINLLKKQNNDGSWNDISLLFDLIDYKKKFSTISDLLTEFPSVEKEIQNLNVESIITLFVICWLYSQRKENYASYNKHIKCGLDYIRSKTEMIIDDDMSKNFHITESIPWKFQDFFI